MQQRVAHYERQQTQQVDKDLPKCAQPLALIPDEFYEWQKIRAHYTSLWIWFIVETPLFQVFRLYRRFRNLHVKLPDTSEYTNWRNVLFMEDFGFGREMDLFTAPQTPKSIKDYFSLELEQTFQEYCWPMIYFLSRFSFLTLPTQGILKRCFCHDFWLDGICC